MRSIKFLSPLLAVALLFGCSAGPTSSGTSSVPRIVSHGSRPYEYKSFEQLADHALALVIVEPTGKEMSKPLPKGYGPDDAAPTPYVEMNIVKVLGGSIKETRIDLVSPGVDENTKRQALVSGGPYLIYITPAMYGANDPAGGYVAVGGPAGVYAFEGDGFRRVDSESPSLPASITEQSPMLTKPTKSYEQLLKEGPR